MGTLLTGADENLFRSKLDSLRTFLTETAEPSASDVHDLVSDILDMLEMCAFGTGG